MVHLLLESFSGDFKRVVAGESYVGEAEEAAWWMEVHAFHHRKRNI